MTIIPIVTVRLVKERSATFDTPITSPIVASDIGRKLIGDLATESMLVILLDTKNRPIGLHVAAIGSVNHVAISAADIFRAAIAAGSPTIIAVHNHPSGDPSPSAEDLCWTTQIVEAGKLLGIDVLDHLIIGEDTHVSLKTVYPASWAKSPITPIDSIGRMQ